mmetsp:Transcript_11132/g.20138  ORF Transcript_11132/g.20138 Transcript_11132/m.20138 type:complete len:226 (-) Transcript_11132:681-1358(-)
MPSFLSSWRTPPAAKRRWMRARTPTDHSPVSDKRSASTTDGWICVLPRTTLLCASNPPCASSSENPCTRRGSSRFTPPSSSLGRARAEPGCSPPTTSGRRPASPSLPSCTSRWRFRPISIACSRSGPSFARRTRRLVGTCASSRGWIWRWPSTSITWRLWRWYTSCSSTFSKIWRRGGRGSSRRFGHSTSPSRWSLRTSRAYFTGLKRWKSFGRKGSIWATNWVI